MGAGVLHCLDSVGDGADAVDLARHHVARLQGGVRVMSRVHVGEGGIDDWGLFVDV